MSDKSHVSMEQACCPVCGKLHDTGAILLDRRLRDSMESHTVTHYALCPEHLKLHEDGYIAFIGVPNDYHPQDNKANINDTPRTGDVVHIRRELAKQMIPDIPDAHLALPLVFTTQGFIDHIKNTMSLEETSTIQ